MPPKAAKLYPSQSSKYILPSPCSWPCSSSSSWPCTPRA